MMNRLFDLLPKEDAIKILKELFVKAEEIFALFQKEYLKDHTIKDAALDTLIDLIQGLKTSNAAPDEKN